MSLLRCFKICLFIIPITVEAYSGSGTSKDPFLINDLTDLQTLASEVNSGISYQDTYFKLMKDIDMSLVYGPEKESNVENEAKSNPNWTPIGKDSLFYFNGYFDGNGHTINHLYIHPLATSLYGDDYTALFGHNAGTIENLHLVNTDIYGRNYVGGLVGYNKGTISKCTNSGNVIGNKSVGGLVGYNDNGNIHLSINSGNITGKSYVPGFSMITEYNQYIGGVVGYNQGTTTHSSNHGQIFGYSLVGGIAGSNANGNIEFSLNTGLVKANTSFGNISGDDSGAFSNNFYDKQMNPIGGINNSDQVNQAEGFLTTQMIGLGLKNKLDTHWIFNEGLYPIPKNLDTLKMAKCTALPILLANEESVDSMSSLQLNLGLVKGTNASINGSIIESNGTVSFINNYFGPTQLLIQDQKGNTYKTATLYLINQPETAIEINSLQDLIAFRDAVNNLGFYKNTSLERGGDKIYFKLTADIVMDTSTWDPIGTDYRTYTLSSMVGRVIAVDGSSNPFKGVFDGNGHSISNLTINMANVQSYFIGSISDLQGLFGHNIGTIKNLTLVNANIYGNDKIGGLVAQNKGHIINCSVSGNISGNKKVGGLVGYNYGIIQYSMNNANVAGVSYVGGITGSNTESIVFCVNTGNITGDSILGSIVGENQGSISNSYYDSQMSPLGGISGHDETDQAEGYLTSELIGYGLKDKLDTHWVFNESLYPIPKNLESSDAAKIIALPIFLTNINNIKNIISNFKLQSMSNVIWLSLPEGILNIFESKVTVLRRGNVKLYSIKDDQIYKTIPLRIINKSLPIGLKKSEHSETPVFSFVPGGFIINIHNCTKILSIYDMKGTLLHKKLITGTTFIDTSKFKTGNYIAKVDQEILKF